MKKSYDLIVIGAGPAGLMASIVAAEKDLKVLLVERKKNISKITRSCCSMWINEPMTHGECISVEEKRVLFRLNDFAVKYTGERIPLKQYLRVSPAGKRIVLENDYDPVSIAFDKEHLLKTLLTQAQSRGVKVLPETLCTDAMNEEDKVSVKLKGSEGEKMEQGKYLIIADGVNSSLSARLGFNQGRTFFGRFQVLSHFYEKVECPYPPAFINFVGSGHLKGSPGSIYMLPKPGLNKNGKKVFEVTIGSPEADPTPLSAKMEYFTREGKFSQWFKRAKLIYLNSALLNFSTPIYNPVKGRTLVVGDAAAFIETYVQGALQYGRSAARAVVGKIKEGKDFSGYLEHWKNTYGYNQPGEIEKATQAYGIQTFGDSDLDYVFGLTDRESYNGYANEFNILARIMKAIYSHLDTIRKEKPELAEKIDTYFKNTGVRESLQLEKPNEEGKEKG